MAKMTRNGFGNACAGLFETAGRALARDGYVHTAILGLNARTQVVETVLSTGPAADEENDTAQPYRRDGVLVVPGPPHQYVDAVAEAFAQARAVAAVFITEAWGVSGEAARQVIETGSRPSEHPDRRDQLALHGVWPEEFLELTITAEIRTSVSGDRVAGEASRSGALVPAWLTATVPARRTRR